MKITKILGGTTAIVSAGLLLGNVAQAEVSVAGTVKYYFYMISDDSTTNDLASVTETVRLSGDYARGYGLTLHKGGSELQFTSKHTSDNGLKYGGRVDLRTGSTGVSLDESYVYVGHDSFGELKVGHTPVNAFGYAGRVGFENVVTGVGAQDGVNYIGAGVSSPTQYPQGNGLVYTTPSFAGFKAGLSWTPSEGENFEQTNSYSGSGHVKENVISVGASYSGEVGGVSYKVGGGGVLGTNATAQAYDANAASGALKYGAKVGSFAGYRVGAMVSMAGFSVAGSLPLAVSDKIDYVNPAVEGEAQTKKSGFDVGLAYDFGVGSVSGTFVQAVTTAFADDTSDSHTYTAVADGGVEDKTTDTSFAVDAKYTLAPGLSVLAEFMSLTTKVDNNNADVDNPTDVKKSQIIVGIQVTF